MGQAGVVRKLAAILAADVVGYSRLMGADEEGTLATLKAHRAERIDPQPMVTDRIGLEALPDAFEALRAPEGQCKVIVEP